MALSRKPAFIGMSRGGEYSYTWATANPDKVSCIYADNPGVQPGRLQEARRSRGGRRAPLARLRQHRSSPGASLVDDREHLSAVRRPDLRDDQGGGRPSSAQPARPKADRRLHFPARSAGAADPPPYLSGRTSRSSFYSRQNIYRYFPERRDLHHLPGAVVQPELRSLLVRTRGAWRARSTSSSPRRSPPGKPWVFRADLRRSRRGRSTWPCWIEGSTS